MKTLLLLRHANSSLASYNQSDFERPLSTTGKNEVNEIALKIKARNISIDSIISSPAVRTTQTAALFNSGLSDVSIEIEFQESLYNSSPETILEIISAINNKHNTVCVICHNPGITDFINTLSEKIKIDNMPTAGILAVTSTINHWKDFEKAEKKFLFFERPTFS
jgi:phosphohistidine phosphatase